MLPQKIIWMECFSLQKPWFLNWIRLGIHIMGKNIYEFESGLIEGSYRVLSKSTPTFLFTCLVSKVKLFLKEFMLWCATANLVIFILRILFKSRSQYLPNRSYFVYLDQILEHLNIYSLIFLLSILSIFFWFQIFINLSFVPVTFFLIWFLPFRKMRLHKTTLVLGETSSLLTLLTFCK